jgi:hypothetical protein
MATRLNTSYLLWPVLSGDKTMFKKALTLMGVVAASVASTANAALSTEISTGLTAIQTDALALVDLVWPVVIAVVGAFIIFKLFKRGISKI